MIEDGVVDMDADAAHKPRASVHIDRLSIGVDNARNLDAPPKWKAYGVTLGCIICVKIGSDYYAGMPTEPLNVLNDVLNGCAELVKQLERIPTLFQWYSK